MKPDMEMAWEVWCYLCGFLAMGVLCLMVLARVASFLHLYD